LETVVVETPASFAICAMVERLAGFSPKVRLLSFRLSHKKPQFR
jgi:hypothetical protein